MKKKLERYRWASPQPEQYGTKQVTGANCVCMMHTLRKEKTEQSQMKAQANRSGVAAARQKEIQKKNLSDTRTRDVRGPQNWAGGARK